VGLKCSYVGYPVADNVRIYTPNQKEEIRQKHGLHKYEKIIVIMPGSRKNELKYHLPVLKKFIQKISNENSNLCYFIATLVSIEDEVKMNFSGKNIIVSSDEAVKKDLIAASDLILCKSGTSVLESVAKRIPMIAFYKMNSLTAYLIKRKLKIKYITICNIVMNKEIIPELLQENFIVKNLLRESKRLLYDTDSIKKQIKDFDEFLKQFHNYNVEKPEHIIQDYLTREK
jgi:lipid-A-disaccharide synthase